LIGGFVHHGDLKKHRDTVVARWIESVIAKYPDRTGEFLRSQTDPFSNPVAAGLDRGLNAIVDGLCQGTPPNDLRDALDEVIRIRAVQDFSAAEAVGFVFDLKSIVHDLVDQDADAGTGSDLEDSIDQLALSAFDVYMGCREEMWAIRAREIRNQSLGIMERMQAWRERRAAESESESLP
jgi:hypothetical protein